MVQIQLAKTTWSLLAKLHFNNEYLTSHLMVWPTSPWELNNSVALRPQKGSPNTWNSRTFTYTPTDYEEGTDSIMEGFIETIPLVMKLIILK